MAYTVGKAADFAEIGATTARDYLRAFPEYFSDGATPPPGSRRSLTWQDIETLATIKQLRAQGQPDEAINATLATGERVNMRPYADNADAPGPGSELITRLTAAASQWEATAKTIADERDHLRNQLDIAQDARRTAEIHAAELQTELRILRELTDDKTPQGEKSSFWSRLFNRNP